MLTVFTGGERFGHMQWWLHGVEIFEGAFDVKRFAKAPSSLTRFWNKFDSQAKSEAWSDRARDFARQALARIENALDLIVRRGQARGEFDAAIKPRELARYLLNAMQGLQVIAKVNPDERALRQIAERTLAGL